MYICDSVECVAMTNKNLNGGNHINWSDYHKGCWSDVREEVHGHPSADERSCSQAGESLAAAPAGRVGPSIISNHHPSLFKVLETLLQVTTEALSGG